MKTVSLTVPLENAALLRASQMLANMAADCMGVELLPESKSVVPHNTPELVVDNEQTVVAPAPVLDPVQTEKMYLVDGVQYSESDLRAAGWTDENLATIPSIDEADAAAKFEQSILDGDSGDKTEPNSEDQIVSEEVDPTGLPWDERINPKSRARLKRDNTWKVKRGLDPNFVEQVRNELRVKMGLIVNDPAAPAPSTEPAAPPPSTEPAAPPPGSAPPPAPAGAQPATTPTTLPVLLQRIQAANIPQETVSAVLQKHDLASLPLLATRPDLIPTIEAELFPSA